MDNNNFNYQQPPYQQPQYQQPQYQPYQQPEPPKKKQGLAIASLILGIVGLTICCCMGIIPGIIGLILGIIAVASKQQGGKGMAIGGIITSALAILVNIILIVAMVNDEDFQEGFREGFEESYYEQTGEHSSFYEGDGDYDYSDDYDQYAYTDDEENDYTSSGDHFWGTNYTCGDDSTIYFFSDGTFDWYLDAEDWTDNVKSGTYTVVFGADARELLTTDLAEYGVTAEELDDFNARNAGSELYNEENLTVLILNTEEVILDGEYYTDPYTTYYYGYSNEEGFDGTNMDSGNYATFYTNY